MNDAYVAAQARIDAGESLGVIDYTLPQRHAFTQAMGRPTIMEMRRMIRMTQEIDRLAAGNVELRAERDRLVELVNAI